MKKFLFASVAAVALYSGPALAQSQMFNWSGIYFGAHAGWSDHKSDWSFNPANATSFPFTTSSSGGTWGGHIGLQQQFGIWVVGVEGALSVLDNKFGSHICPNAADTCQTKVSNLFTLGPRIGYSINNWLFFANGGYANGGVYGRAVINANGVIVEPANTRNHGWYLGGGLEYAVTKNIIVGLEYQHVDLGSELQVPVGGAPRDVNATENIVRARLTFKPGAPFGISQ